MNTDLGRLSRVEVAQWDRIDWFRSTAELSRQVTAVVGRDHPAVRVHIGYRRLGWDAVAFVAHHELITGAGAELTAEIERVAGEVLRTRGWVVHRGTEAR